MLTKRGRFAMSEVKASSRFKIGHTPRMLSFFRRLLPARKELLTSMRSNLQAKQAFEKGGLVTICCITELHHPTARVTCTQNIAKPNTGTKYLRVCSQHSTVMDIRAMPNRISYRAVDGGLLSPAISGTAGAMPPPSWVDSGISGAGADVSVQPLRLGQV